MGLRSALARLLVAGFLLAAGAWLGRPAVAAEESAVAAEESAVAAEESAIAAEESAIALGESVIGTEGPAVLRGYLRSREPVGAVFFLPAPGTTAGVVAVGAAHSFDRTRLAESGELLFRSEPEGDDRAIASRYFAAPGRAYHGPGANLRDDYVLFALESPPRGVRVLSLAERRPAMGDPVRILGLPVLEHGKAGDSRVELVGTVTRVEAAALEVELASVVDLRGFGGAPVLDANGRVLGLLQSAWISDGRMLTGVGPIAGVEQALAEPFEAGLGRLFATQAPPASAANSPAERRREATGSAFGDLAPGRSAAQVVAAGIRADAAPRLLAPRTLQLELVHPQPEALLGDAAGAFVAGRASWLRGDRRRFDVVLVIDTSQSTNQPSGIDVDEDGELGVPRTKAGRGVLEGESTDLGDSVLAAEVAAASQLVAGLDPRVTRVGIVSFAGDLRAAGPAGLVRPQVKQAALTQEPLTTDYRRLQGALERLAARGGRGLTHMAAGVDQATLELLGLPGALSAPDPDSEKIVLFFTDGQPTLPYPAPDRNVVAVLQAADRASRAGVRIHSFAIGPEALDGPISTVEMAARTEGIFTPVRDPARLARFVEGLSFAGLADLSVQNVTTGESGSVTEVHGDGSFEALVPLEVGGNEFEVTATALDGTEARERRAVYYVPGVERPPMPAELLAKRGALLQRRVVEIQAVRDAELRKELILEMERERAAAVARAEEQRKQLEIQVLPDSGDR